MAQSIRHRLIENFLSLVVLQGVNYVLPLLTLPYLVRVLGTGNYGTITFAAVFNQFFAVFTDYGFNLSATREIAINRADSSKVARVFSTVMLLKVVFLGLSFVVMSVIVGLVPSFRAEPSIYFISFLTVIGTAIFPTWFFQGMERMRYITVINICTKAVATLAIFILVHRQGDFLMAALIQSLGFLAGGISSLVLIKHNFPMRLSWPSLSEIRTALKDGWHVFASTVMGNILGSSGVFILGLYQPRNVLGAYAAVEKVVKALVGLFAPATQAVYPYTSAQFAISHAAGRRAVWRTGKYIVGCALVVTAVSIVFAGPIVKLLYGVKLLSYSKILTYLSIWMVLGILNNVLGFQYLIGSGQAKQYSYGFLLSTLATLGIFFLLIPHSSYYGVVLGMDVGEVILTCCLVFLVYKDKGRLGNAAQDPLLDAR